MAAKSIPKKASVQIDVVVTLEDVHRDNIEAVARRLEAAGLSAAKALKSAGIITGSVAHGKLEGIKSVEGVRAVEAAGGVQIAPPDAPVQ